MFSAKGGAIPENGITSSRLGIGMSYLENFVQRETEKARSTSKMMPKVTPKRT